MTDITADEYRTAAKVVRKYDMLGSAGKFERLAAELETVDVDLAIQITEAVARAVDGRDLEGLTSPRVKEIRDATVVTLGYLDDRCRLVPAGGMALTAEQVEDVRLLLDSFASERDECDTWDLYERLRALFPATEPAEEVQPCTVCNLGESAAGHFDYDHPFTTELGPFDDDGNDRPDPAPAVLAEEETKADWCVLCYRSGHNHTAHKPQAPSPVVPAPTEPVYVNVPTWQEVSEGITYQGEGKAVRYVNRDGQPYNLGSSKPLSDTFEQLEDFMRPQGPFYFVPAPTASEWPTWQEVPDGVPYRSSLWTLGAVWFNRDNNRYVQTSVRNSDGTPYISGVDDDDMNTNLAPFVAAEEGDA